jgi:hypothetical protein
MKGNIMTIYVITTGAYSDYHIMGVTDSKENAENIVKKWNQEEHLDEAIIEEYDTDIMDKYANGYDNYWVYGDILNNDLNVEIDNIDTKGSGIYRNWTKDNRWHISTNILAKSEEHALKIAYERIREWKLKMQLEGINWWE